MPNSLHTSMAGNTGSLIINIKGESSGARKAFADTKQSADQFKQSMGDVQNSLGNIGGSLQGLTGLNLNISQITNTVGGLKNALAAGGIAGLVTAGISVAAQAVEALAAKFVALTQAAMAQAKQLKLTSGELGVTAERLQGLQKLAQKSGIDPEQATKGLERMLDLLGEFRQGSEEATKTLKTFGITANQAAGMGTSDLYAAVAEKIKATGSAADRAALASEVFGRKLGPELVKMLAQGEAGLDSVMQKMRATGQLMSSGEMVKLTELKSSFAGIQDQFGNAWRELLVSIIPAMKGINNELVGIVKGVSDLINWAKDGLRVLGLMQSKKDEDKSNEKDFLKTAGIEQKIDFFSTKISELKAKAAGGLFSKDDTIAAYTKEINTITDKISELRKQAANVGIGGNDAGLQSKIEAYKKQIEDIKQKAKSISFNSDQGELFAAQQQLQELRSTQQRGYIDAEAKKAQELVQAAKDEAMWAGKTKEEREAAQLHKHSNELWTPALEEKYLSLRKQAEEASEKIAKSASVAEAAYRTKEAARLKSEADKAANPFDSAAKELEVMAYKQHALEAAREQWAKETEHYNQLKSKAKEIAEAINPAHKFADTFHTMQEMLQKGLMTQKQFGAELTKEKASIMQNLRSEAPSFSNAATKAGSEGMAEVAKLMEQEQQEQWAEKQLEALTKSLDISKSSDSELKTIRQLLTENRKVTVAI